MEDEELPPPEGTEEEVVVGEDEEMANVSPEEQAQYDTFVKAAMDLMYTGEPPKVMPEILEALKPAAEAPTDNGSPPVMALANTAVQIIQRVDTAGFEANQPVGDEVLYHAAVEIIEQLSEIAETAGIHEYDEEEVNGALFQAIDLYRPIAIQLGRTDENTLKQQFGEIEQADRAGKLGELMPGLGGPQAQAGG